MSPFTAQRFIELAALETANQPSVTAQAQLLCDLIDRGVVLLGEANLARSLPADSSALYARNLFNFLAAFWSKEAGWPVLPDDDEIVKTIRLTQDGRIVSERLAG